MTLSIKIEINLPKENGQFATSINDCSAHVFAVQLTLYEIGAQDFLCLQMLNNLFSVVIGWPMGLKSQCSYHNNDLFANTLYSKA